MEMLLAGFEVELQPQLKAISELHGAHRVRGIRSGGTGTDGEGVLDTSFFDPKAHCRGI